MIEDKLSHDERLRLECLSLAAATSNITTPDGIVHKAKLYEQYLRGDNEND